MSRPLSGPLPPARGSPRDGAGFWNEFRARAAAEARVPHARTLPARPPVLATLATVAAVALAAALWPRSGPTEGHDTQIASLQVMTAHESVFIMPMEEGGVMVWIGTGEPHT